MRVSSQSPQLVPLPAGSEQYEKPTGGGQSNMRTEPSFDQLYGLRKSEGTPGEGWRRGWGRSGWVGGGS